VDIDEDIEYIDEEMEQVGYEDDEG
jgi:hypothetical protein